MRVVRTRSLRGNGSRVLFEEDLILVGELRGVEDSYSSEKDVTAEGVCVKTSVVFDSSEAEAETIESVEGSGAVSRCVDQEFEIKCDPILRGGGTVQRL